jgi:gliding motility-associated-like protein
MTDFKGTLQQPDTAITWNWNFGDGRTSSEQNNTIAYDKAGGYLVSLTAANELGCKNTDTFSVNVAPLPVITFENPVIPVGGSSPIPVDYSGGITRYSWSPPDGLSCTDCPVPTANPVKTTIYTVNVTDSNTCTASAQITVDVRCQAENYFVPNTFSPNGDGANDIFYPRGRGVASVQSMRVYNRWGQMIFSRRNFTANDPSKGWDGSIGSSPALPDVYVYVVEFVCENSQVVTLKGNVTLIR